MPYTQQGKGGAGQFEVVDRYAVGYGSYSPPTLLAPLPYESSFSPQPYSPVLPAAEGQPPQTGPIPAYAASAAAASAVYPQDAGYGADYGLSYRGSPAPVYPVAYQPPYAAHVADASAAPVMTPVTAPDTLSGYCQFSRWIDSHKAAAVGIIAGIYVLCVGFRRLL